MTSQIASQCGYEALPAMIKDEPTQENDKANEGRTSQIRRDPWLGSGRSHAIWLLHVNDEAVTDWTCKERLHGPHEEAGGTVDRLTQRAVASRSRLSCITEAVLHSPKPSQMLNRYHL